ncbi:LysM peptidoglycan-binding domain-containing protein [Micromonospora sp. NPDC003197]
MPTTYVSAVRPTVARRTGQIVTGFAALVVLLGLLVGAPLALAMFAGNPLPDHLPGVDEITATLTSRDDGQLFLRALAIVGWAGWASFALSVLVELPARIRRKPAPRLPGLSRQQRVASALVGSIALIAVATPAAAAATPATAVAIAAAPAIPDSMSVPPTGTAHRLSLASPAGTVHRTALTSPVPHSEPVYRVEKDDYLGYISDRYLGDFDRYRELAKLNKIRDPNRIRPGQLLRMPADAADRGVRVHATGLVAVPPPPGTRPAVPPVGARETPGPARNTPSAEVTPVRQEPGEATLAVGAARPGEVNQLNRPLAVSAVLTVASIVGAQIGAVLGLRRRPADRRSAATRAAATRAVVIGRHRRD